MNRNVHGTIIHRMLYLAILAGLVMLDQSPARAGTVPQTPHLPLAKQFPILDSPGNGLPDYQHLWNDHTGYVLGAAGIFLSLALLISLLLLQKRRAKHAEARLRALYNGITDAMLIHWVGDDPDHSRFVEVNDVACQLLGYTREELLGMSPFDIDAPDSGVDVPDISKRLEMGDNVIFEQVHITKDKRRIPVEINTSLFMLNNRRAVVSLVRDITKHKETEEELRNYARRLIAMEEELRKQLATELHDEIGRDLTALNINMAIIGDSLKDAVSEQVAARLEDSWRLIEDISRTTRSIMTNLRPPVLDDYGLLPALRWHADIFCIRNGISVSVRADKQFPRLTAEKEMALFRIAQEALTNVAKHAMAQQVAIVLASENNTIRLSINDDGIGIAPGVTSTLRPDSGWGIKGMRERAALLGGNLTLRAEPGKGTMVSVEIRGHDPHS